MKRLLAVLCLAVLESLGSAHEAAAQDLVITNARILDGSGGVIERGAVVVRDGKIVSVAAGAAPAVAAARVIDAQGMTVMPGFIEAHRHVMQGDATQWLKQQAPARMQEFLDAGFTTVLSAGDGLEGILELRQRLQTGDIRGPRLIVSGRVALARPAGGAAGGERRVDGARFDAARPPNRPRQAAPAIPHEETRAAVRKMKEAGVDAIKTGILVSPGGPEKDTLAVVADEARKQGLLSITHAVAVEDAVAAVEAGTHVLVHTPHIGQLSEEHARMIGKAGIPMTSTLAIFVPHFDAENRPLFRDRGPFPWDTLSSAGQGPVNARLLWEAGITYGYGTDTTWPPRESLADELRALQLVFSPKDIVTILTKNAAAGVGRRGQLGTLEAGKIADLVILRGDPLANVSNLLNVAMVIKGGAVVVDRR
jgi:imidazolonepropionase-like amidohydrolase